MQVQLTRGRSQGQTEIRGEGLRKEMSADRGGEEGRGREDGGAMGGLSGDARKGGGSLDREIGKGKQEKRARRRGKERGRGARPEAVRWRRKI